MYSWEPFNGLGSFQGYPVNAIRRRFCTADAPMATSLTTQARHVQTSTAAGDCCHRFAMVSKYPYRPLNLPHEPATGTIWTGCKSIQQGHIVLVLFGGDCPFVLREDGVERGKHKIVGDGYMNRFIDGEGMTDEMAGRNLEFTIV